jgi:hypothetical protein
MENKLRELFHCLDINDSNGEGAGNASTSLMAMHQ